MQLLGVMRAQASDGGMLPEQVWDGPDMPELELENGRATGGAMPLVWAHAEYAKLVRSLHDGRVFDMPQQPYERYVRLKQPVETSVWAPHCHTRTLPAGRRFRVQTSNEFRVEWWFAGDEAQLREMGSQPTGLGVWIADLDTTTAPVGSALCFRLSDIASRSGAGEVHALTVVERVAAVLAPKSRTRTTA